jgi:ABC-type polysaccharide/polyol phosphate transport system ATPase subunit
MSGEGNGSLLRPGVAVQFEGVSKFYKGGGTRATVPIPWPFPGGTDWRARERGEAFVDDDEDEIEEEEEIVEDEPVPEHDTWALRDIDLEIPEGQSLGIIGPNGSGKSTLLKTVARITPPTEGRLLVRGQVAPLLTTVSSFFSPSATGRQNIHSLARFFNVPRHVVDRNMDEIFEFADLTDLIDIKGGAYSSGQYQRLGFSAALHLESDIILAEDAFVVGDAAFRDRGIARMEEARAAGLTLMYASHDLSLVERLCDRVVWMEEGRIVEQGEPAEMVAHWTHFREAAKQGARRQPGASRLQESRARTQGAERDGVKLSKDCALLLDFLTVALGDAEAGAVLDKASSIAAARGAAEVGWHDLADSAGYERTQAEALLERLREREAERTSMGTQRVFNEHIGIVAGGVHAFDMSAALTTLRADEPAWLAVRLQVATPEIFIRCMIRLRTDDAEPVEIDQPDELPIVEAPKSCKIFVELPGNALAPGMYRCDVLVAVAKGDAHGFVNHPGLFEFEVYDPDPEATDEDGEPERTRIDGAELEWRVR